VTTCASCSNEVPEASRFCLSCGASLDSSAIPTLLDYSRPPPSGSHSTGDDPERVRLEPGVVLGGRYRILGPLGRGGMGEVFHADDLKLGQQVALKFLPALFATDPGRVARFHGEVRLARQVSHPNVCRVYDIGEADGHHYISMEYVDGEDLSSLLRRIGRLPGDKAVELARQLCAGLAAAHERGVLHRDLKPANVMIDGRGRVRITDFGLAALAVDLKGAGAREGTPYYMAPEQLAGKTISIRSDLYSLGLVLYEMLTGRPPFKADTMAEMSRIREKSTPATPSSIVFDLDPALERVILRCLEHDPAARPASALAVAAALPGADPLAAALAAGETPSPEMVAAAGDVGGIQPAMGLACLAVLSAGCFALAALGPAMLLPGRVPLVSPPQVLEARAREVIGRLGYTEQPADAAGSFSVDDEALLFIERNDASFDRWERIRGGRPAVMQYWYRQSPRSLEPTDFFGHLIGSIIVDPTDPPPVISGMVGVRLDSQGRLIELSAVPPQVDKVQGASPEPDWQKLLAESGLDLSMYRPAESEWLPPVYSDARSGWVRRDADRRDLPDRVEAAAYRGRPVYFQMIWPWTRPARMLPYHQTRGEVASRTVLVIIFLAVLVGGVLVARHNLRLGRGDRRGAVRLALFVMAVLMAIWLLRTSHVATFYELGLFIMGISGALFGGGLVWLLYIALEPYVRRRWPLILISWSRLLAGRLRDPLVGRDLLLGSLFGVGVQVFVILVRFSTWAMGLAPIGPIPTPVSALMGVQFAAADFLLRLTLFLFASMALLFLFFLLRLAVRKEWLVGLIIVLIFGVNSAAVSNLPAVGFVLSAGVWTSLLLILTRRGLLALVVAFFVCSLAQAFLLTLDPTAWYAGTTWLAIAVIVALSGYGLKVALAGRPVFGAIGLDE
jgi:serine/threonine-protein kinase